MSKKEALNSLHNLIGEDGCLDDVEVITNYIKGSSKNLVKSVKDLAKDLGFDLSLTTRKKMFFAERKEVDEGLEWNNKKVLENELPDEIITAILLGEAYGIDMEEAINNKLEEVRSRGHKYWEKKKKKNDRLFKMELYSCMEEKPIGKFEAESIDKIIHQTYGFQNRKNISIDNQQFYDLLLNKIDLIHLGMYKFVRGS